MADDINDMRLFVGLVAAGSLSAAARAFSSSPAVMSRRLAALEARLGVRLITRTTHRFALTEEGVLFHERCLPILAAVGEAEAEVGQGAARPHGNLHVSAPVQWGRRVLAPMIGGFCAAYPDVAVRLTLTDAGPDVVENGLDVVLRVGRPVQADTIARRLVAGRRLVCAAPSYLARHGVPRAPDDLLAHDCIRLTRGRAVFDRWVFCDGEGTRHVQVGGRLTTSSGEVLHDWARAGYGVALKAEWDIAEDLATGRLVACLTDHWCDVIEIYACYASRQHLAPRIARFLDTLTTTLQQPAAAETPI
jgi:DNA-binding transcriptional LysR family regulator